MVRNVPSWISAFSSSTILILSCICFPSFLTCVMIHEDLPPRNQWCYTTYVEIEAVWTSEHVYAKVKSRFFLLGQDVSVDASIMQRREEASADCQQSLCDRPSTSYRDNLLRTRIKNSLACPIALVPNVITLAAWYPNKIFHRTWPRLMLPIPGQLVTHFVVLGTFTVLHCYLPDHGDVIHPWESAGMSVFQVHHCDASTRGPIIDQWKVLSTCS